MNSVDEIQRAAQVIKQGGIVAYPTEAVFGIGCDPLNEQALLRIISLKARDPKKGLILVGGTIEHIKPFVDLTKVPQAVLAQINSVWPGPYTYVMPASDLASSLLKGGRSTIAVRVSAHSAVQQICAQTNGAIVSTSCNVSGENPLKTAQEVEKKFGASLDYIVHLSVGNQEKPTEIRDALTGKILRKG